MVKDYKKKPAKFMSVPIHNNISDKEYNKISKHKNVGKESEKNMAP